MDDAARKLRSLVQNLESLHGSGVRSIPRGQAVLAGTNPIHASGEAAVARATPDIRVIDPAPAAAAPATAPVTSPLPQDRPAALEVLAAQVASCTRCSELVASRSQTVFGVGNPQARLVFFGEAPGADEDRLGEPFVGKAGQLLTKIIEACKMTREDVYIMNVLKCRPPANRNPTGEEAAACRPFFEQQFDIIRPEFICCLGAIAATTLLETKQSIGRLRGRFYPWRGMQVMATYHPAYLLRNPAAKKLVWADMKMLMKEMGVQL